MQHENIRPAKRRLTTKRLPFLMAALAALALTTAAGAAPIQVNVNGAPVRFTGTPPTEVHGSVLVPLRGVFEALGASVNYNPVTKTINAEKGAATMMLPLGSLTATVNGQTQTLSQPAQSVGGTTLVPLRFVAQALGANVQWVAPTRTVEIRTAEPHLASLPAAPGRGTVVGQLTGVYANANPQTLTVRVNGQNTVVPLSANTIVLRSAPNQPATQVALAQLQPGDQVTVQRGADGSAVSVTATYGEVRGSIKSIGKLASGASVVTLNDGTTVEIAPNVPVMMAGRHVALSDVMANETVVIRTNPSNNLGFGVAVVTPDNPTPTPPGQAPGQAGGNGQVTITSFTQNATGPLKAGDVLTATLAGTPGGQASFSIPGVVDSVAMRETAPGTYTGTYRVPANVNVTGAAALGRLTVGNASAPLIQAAGAVTVDSAPPKVAELSPAQGATTEGLRPLIYATVSDAGGVGVDPAATRVILDGQDVTSQATVTPAFFSLKPAQPLALGAHTVRVTVADRAGNAATTEWPFTVAPNTLVQSFESSATAGQAVGAGDTVRFTLRAQPGGRATVGLGGAAPDIALSETSPGVYTGQYVVQAGQSLQDAPVSAKFVAANGQTVTTALASGLTVAAGAPTAPVITSPADGGTAGQTLTVEGTAAPGATVRVSVDYVSKALGVFALKGSAGSQEVKADANGHWRAADLSLQTNTLFGLGRNTDFTVSAVTVSANGDLSPAATVTVHRG